MGAKTRYCTGHLYTTLWEGWTNHLSHSSGPTPGPAPAFMPYKEQAYCPPAHASLTPHPPREQETFFSLPLAAAGAPTKPYFNFSSDL